MKKLHAVGAGIIGVALSTTAALAAAPHVLPSSPTVTTDHPTPKTNHGATVSAVAKDKTQVGGKHDNHGGAVSAAARAAHDPKTDATTSEGEGATDAATADQTPKTNHGATVSAVAKDKTQVGGKHDNHGGAVSAAAHAAHDPKTHPDKHANKNKHANEDKHADKH